MHLQLPIGHLQKYPETPICRQITKKKRSPRAKITRERDTSATTGTSNVTAADSVSTASDDKGSYPDVMAPIRKAQGRDSGKLNKSADGSRPTHPAPSYRSMTSPPSATPLF